MVSIERWIYRKVSHPDSVIRVGDLQPLELQRPSSKLRKPELSHKVKRTAASDSFAVRGQFGEPPDFVRQ
jgi:hypothetical protein